jgi:hypothetical protein
VFSGQALTEDGKIRAKKSAGSLARDQSRIWQVTGMVTHGRGIVPLDSSIESVGYCLRLRHRQFLLRHILVDLGEASPVFDTESPGVNEQLLQTLLAELAVQ